MRKNVSDKVYVRQTSGNLEEGLAGLTFSGGIDQYFKKTYNNPYIDVAVLRTAEGAQLVQCASVFIVSVDFYDTSVAPANITFQQVRTSVATLGHSSFYCLQTSMYIWQ